MGILNDSTGTLMSCAHKNHDCKIGIIIGKRVKTKIKKQSILCCLQKLKKKLKHKVKLKIINTS